MEKKDLLGDVPESKKGNFISSIVFSCHHFGVRVIHCFI